MSTGGNVPTKAAGGHVHGKNCNHDHMEGSKNKKGKKNMAIIGYCFFTCLSVLYLSFNCFYPVYPDFAQKRMLLSLCILLVIMALWSYTQTVCTDNFLNKVKGRPILLQKDERLDYNYLEKQCEHS